MKRIILSAMVAAFAIAVQAGDSPSCQDKEKAACCPSKVPTSIQAQTTQDTDKAESACSASKVKTSVEAKGSCPFTAGGCSKQGKAKQNGSKRNVLLSPKATSIASK